MLLPLILLISTSINSNENEEEYLIPSIDNKNYSLVVKRTKPVTDVKNSENKTQPVKDSQTNNTENNYSKKTTLHINSENDLELYAAAFSAAPARLKVIIEDMLEDHAYTQSYKEILLCGPTGSGKTTLAQAIAHKLNRKCILVRAPSLLGHFRHQTAENLLQLFKEIEESPEKPILILDEINALTDGHNSEHSDTRETAMQLWTLLDKYKNDKNFLLIGTTNVTKKMPHQLQSRFQSSIFLIDNPTEEFRKHALVNIANKSQYTLDQSCTTEFLNNFSKKTTKFSHRDLEDIIAIAISLTRIESTNNSSKRISSHHLDQSLAELMQIKEKFCDYSDHLTDEERRHQESLKQNKQQYEDNKELLINNFEASCLLQAVIASRTTGHSNPSMRDLVKHHHNVMNLFFPHREVKGKVIVGRHWSEEISK